MKITDTLKQIIEKVEPYYTEWQKEIDITAIEKYIVDNGWIGLKFIKWNIDYKEVWINWKTYIFPFKDPSLYTEEELKHLLEILNNI